MIFDPTPLDGVVVVRPEPRSDERGSFARTWCAREFAAAGLSTRIAQANAATTTHRGTLRGMHYQLPPAAEAKLVTCTRGAVHDVVVDLRPESPTFGEHVGVEISADNGLAVYVPELCAHGYLSLTDDVEVRYQVSEFYAPAQERGFRWDDPRFAIEWPIEPVVVSDKDRAWSPYEDVA